MDGNEKKGRKDEILKENGQEGGRERERERNKESQTGRQTYRERQTDTDRQTLTLGVRDILDPQSMQRSTCLKAVVIIHTAFKREMFASTPGHHQGIVEQVQAQSLNVLVCPEQ